MILIGSEKNYSAAGLYELKIQDMDLLLINQDSALYLIENKCGHFGISLADGQLKPKEIVCSGHSMSFSLETGEVLNRPYEVCDPIKTYEIVKKDGDLYINVGLAD